MKEGISAGIGLFISFVGLQSAHIVVASPATLVTLGNFTDPVTYMSLIGLFISIILVINNVRGALFLGMIITSVISFLFGYISLPDTIFAAPQFGDTFMQMDVAGALSSNLFTIIFTFFIVTLLILRGTMLGIAKQAGLMQGDTFPNVKSALLPTPLPASSVPYSAPARPQLMSSLLRRSQRRTHRFCQRSRGTIIHPHAVCAPLAKVLAEVPAVTAPALIIVGFYMMSSLSRIDWNDMQELFRFPHRFDDAFILQYHRRCRHWHYIVLFNKNLLW